MNEKDKIIAGAVVFILLLSTVIFAIQNDSDDDDDKEGILEEDYVLEASMDYMLAPKVVVTASTLHTDLNDGITNNDPFLLDIRGNTDYEAGHIPGAINIPYTSVFSTENIQKLPIDQQIVVICFTGHTASQTTAMLNTAGFDAIALKWGFEGWTDGGHGFDPESDAHTYEVVTGTEPGSFVAAGTRCGDDDDDDGGDDDPDPDPDPTDDDDDDAGDVDGNLSADVITAAHTYLQSGKPAATKATALRDNLNDGDTSNDPFIFDIRAATAYEAGHIGGAINVPFASVFTTENLSKLPKDQQIVVVCYTGHTASQITALLNINGYNAIALKWGFESWGNGGKAFDPATRPDYEVEFSPIPVANTYMAAGKSAATSAATVHDNLNDGDASDDPFILDIRGMDDYVAGHIAGSVNVPFRDVFKPENLPLYPLDQQIVVVCYTGHTASQATALLNMAGYDAIALKWGFEGWTDGGKSFDPATAVGGYDVETGAGTMPAVGETPGKYISDVAEAANAFMDEGNSPAITSSTVHTNLEDGNAANDPFILDIRGATDYEAGHVPGAVNVPYRSVFTWDNITYLPTDTQIVVVCYTGHTASQTTAMLGLAGYDSIAMKWGFESWKASGKAFDPATRPDYEVEVGGTIDLRELGATYLGEGKSAATSATSLYDNLEDGDSSNDPFVLDIRGFGDYAAGHIPGSVNVPYREVFRTENLPLYPTDQQIVVVCYTGHTASQTTALLNMAGFDAIALKWGFEGWASRGKSFDPATVPDYAVSTTTTVSSDTSSGEAWSNDVAQSADAYMDEGKSAATSATSLYDNLEDGDSSNDPFVLDIRAASAYAEGHIPGAVNIPFRSVFSLENITQLPDDRQIVVVCYTGHTASQMTAMLNLAGYDAIAMKWGMSGWIADYGSAFDPATRPDYAVEVWYDVPAECNDYLAEGKPAAMSASALRTNMDDGDVNNNPFILDIRGASDYETNHIPTAINVGFRSVFTTENLSKLPADDTLIVVVCYSGHTASQITALLNVAGYNATALKWGFSGWEAGNPSVYNHTKITAHAEETTVNAASGNAEAIYVTSLTEAANDYLALGKGVAMSGDSLNDTLGTMDEPYILDIRGASDYEAGHVPGAVNIPYTSVFTEENFAKLPTGVQIVVVCYSGHTASQTTAMLNLAGLDAIALKWGYAGWIPKASYPGTIEDDNPMVSGTEPGDWP
jgi:rhodanese-related sulfurtransferase